MRAVQLSILAVSTLLVVACGSGPGNLVRREAPVATVVMMTPLETLPREERAGLSQPVPSLQPDGTTTVTPAPVVTPASSMPVINSFTCDPCGLDAGESATLRWDVSDAIWVTLDDQGVEGPGSTSVQPDQTTTYRLIAANENGRSEKTVTVEVRGLPVIHHFTCEPCQVEAGASATLSWDLSGGTAAYLDGEGVTAPGSTVVLPEKTTTYHLEAVGDRGSVERMVTVTVVEAADPDTVRRALAQVGYRVQAVGYHPLAAGGRSMMVVMAAACDTPPTCAQATAEQYLWGLKVLYDSRVTEPLSVGLYDGERYTTFVTVPPSAVQAFLRGDWDGESLWQAGRWNVWDDWHSGWLSRNQSGQGDKDFAGIRFAR